MIWMAPNCALDPIDLEETPSSFILEMQRLEIPGFPYAFNPSILRTERGVLMSFRLGSYVHGSEICGHTPPCLSPQNRDTSKIGLIWLDDQFQIASQTQVLKIPRSAEDVPFRPQDPRLIEVGGKIYLVYNNFTRLGAATNQRMYFAELFYDGGQFALGASQCLIDFEEANPGKTEKNWTPFDYQGQLHFSYSFSPHTVFRPLDGTSSCITVGSTQGAIAWQWGHLRGGTTALKVGDEYLGFFHSVMSMKTVHSEQKKIPHYFMGAYTCAATPPFSLTAVSPEPIVGEGFYTGERYVTWKPLIALFPAGYIFDENYIWVAYGKQDHEIWIAKLDKQGLLDSLVPVASVRDLGQ